MLIRFDIQIHACPKQRFDHRNMSATEANRNACCHRRLCCDRGRLAGAWDALNSFCASISKVICQLTRCGFGANLEVDMPLLQVDWKCAAETAGVGVRSGCLGGGTELLR